MTFTTGAYAGDTAADRPAETAADIAVRLRVRADSNDAGIDSPTPFVPPASFEPGADPGDSPIIAVDGNTRLNNQERKEAPRLRRPGMGKP